MEISESKGSAAIVDGSIFRFAKGAQFVHSHLTQGRLAQRAAVSILKEPSAFAAILGGKQGLSAFRDLNGLKPLYYARDQHMVALASERKALRRIGLTDVNRITPGLFYSVTRSKLSQTSLAHLPHPREKKMTILQAAKQLSPLLRKSIRQIVRGVDAIAVAFSGGLDSALTAFLAKKVHPNLEAVSVGLPGSPELSTVGEFARELGLPITVETFNADSLQEYVRRVVWLIEEANLMKVSVAVPLHWAAKVAAKRGCKVMLCGQGSDELYGGYYKYAKTLDNKGRKALVAELYDSVVNSAEVNYERDDKATSPFGVELRTPFADLDVIRFSLSIPSEFKVRSGNDLTRKWVLRTVAENMGVPRDIAWRRKKAIQHGTGVESAIRRLAKNQGLTAEEYLLRVHQEVIGMDTMP